MTETARLCVLVAEDSRLQRRVLVAHLQRLGVGAVIECDDCPSAAAAVRGEGAPFDLVFLDLNMPGDDTAGLLRALAGTPRLGPVSITSAEEPDALRDAESLCDALGIRRVATTPKPVTPDHLVGLLAAL